MNIEATPLSQLVDAIAADRPSPGCGVAAASALALGASCAAKAFAISARRRGGDSELEAACAEALDIARDALMGGQQDCEAFPRLLEGGSDDAESVRDLRLVGRRLSQACADLTVLIEEFGATPAPDLQGDLAAAHDLLKACERITARNLAALD